jgi:hypothetical protein
MTVFESYFGERAGSVTLVDEFAQARGTRGPMPGPIPPLRFQLTHREVLAVMTPLEDPIDLKTLRGTSGSYILTDEGRQGATAPWQRTRAGRYRLRIESDYYQPHELDLDWPAHGPLGPELLRPGYNYPFPDVSLPSERITLLRGTVRSGFDGEPVENATVAITNPAALGPFVGALTGENGSWVLAFRHANLNPINATVRITLPDATQINVANVLITPAADNSLPQTSLRGFVMTTSGRPVRNAEVTVDFLANASVRSDVDGRWQLYFDVNQVNELGAHVTATAPGGQNQTQPFPVVNRATGVVPDFRIAI